MICEDRFGAQPSEHHPAVLTGYFLNIIGKFAG
jgi:hypothetical protein